MRPQLQRPEASFPAPSSPCCASLPKQQDITELNFLSSQTVCRSFLPPGSSGPGPSWLKPAQSHRVEASRMLLSKEMQALPRDTTQGAAFGQGEQSHGPHQELRQKGLDFAWRDADQGWEQPFRNLPVLKNPDGLILLRGTSSGRKEFEGGSLWWPRGIITAEVISGIIFSVEQNLLTAPGSPVL